MFPFFKINSKFFFFFFYLIYSGLGFLSISFDLLFMTQHYILYRNREDPDILDILPDENSESTLLIAPQSDKQLNRYV